MKNAAATRVAGEICTLLLIYCLIDPVLPRLWLLAAFIAAVVACGIFAMRFDRAVIRLACCLPAALLLLAADRLVTLIVLAVCWLYAAIRFTVGRFSDKHWVYRREFIALTAVAILASLLIAAGEILHIQTPPGVIGFGAASILLGIFSLRVMRLESLNEPGWCAYSALELALPLGAATGISALIWFLLQGLYSVLRWIAGLFWEGEKPAPTPSTPTPPAPSFHFIPQQTPGGTNNYVMEELPEPTKTPVPIPEQIVDNWPPYVWLILLVLLAIAAVAVVLYIRRRKKNSQTTDEVEETDTKRFGRRKQSEGISADRRIRTTYRTYLRGLKQQGMRIRSGDTSLDVLTAAEEKLLSPEARELRELYLVARYGDAKSLTQREADRADACLAAIENSVCP